MRRAFLALLLPTCVMAQGSVDGWRQEILRARSEKDVLFRTGPASPLAGVQRLTLEAGQSGGLRATEEGVEIAGGEAPVVVRQIEGVWTWCTPEAKASMAGGAVFSLGRFQVQGQPGPQSITLLVFDPSRPEVIAFKGLRYFPPSRAFAVQATLEPVRGAAPITLTTTRSLKKTFTPYARVRFMLGGKAQALTAYKAAGEESMFIPFTDATTGRETYTVGRFLEIPAPKGKAFVLDFNRAFNPLCNYSGIWNCPLPPEENALMVAVRAGEKAYPHQ